MKISNTDCPHGCNSRGEILWNGRWLPCPIHGKAFKGLDLKEDVLEDGRSIFDILMIPMDYRDNWITDIPQWLAKNSDIAKNCIKTSILQLKDLLEEIYNLVAIENNIYMESVYVYSNPALLDLKPFVYTIQRIAFENNISVLPATTINDLAGLSALQDFSTITLESHKNIEYINSKNRLAGVGADWSYRTGLTYTDYLRASICFLFDNNATNTGSLRILEGFLEERSQRGLPTYVFSTTFFDGTRSKMFYDKSGRRKLSCLNPYLLLGRNMEVTAREEGWFLNKKALNPKEVDSTSDISGFQAATFQTAKQNNKPIDFQLF